MTHVATFRPSSDYPNQRVIFDGERFTIEGSGEVDLRYLTSGGKQSALVWASDEMRDWAYGLADESTHSDAAVQSPRAGGSAKPLYKRGWFLVVAAVVVLLLFMCFACTVLGMFADSDSSDVGTLRQGEATVEEAEEDTASPDTEEPAETSDTDTTSDADESLPAPQEEAEEPEQVEEAVEDEPVEPTEPSGPGIGDTVRAGEFDYTVNSVSSTKEIGEEPFSETTDGEFLLVNVTIKNNDSEGRVMDSSMFSLLDSQGNEYDQDGGAAMFLDEGSLFLENVNPGMSRTGVIVFEIPEGLSDLSLEVDSGVMFAAGETKVIHLDR